MYIINTDNNNNKIHTRIFPVKKWILFLLSIAYVILPFDLIPDFPVLGWVDDISLISAAGLNLLQHYLPESNPHIRSILSIVKWILILLALFIILLILIFGTILVRLFQ